MKKQKKCFDSKVHLNMPGSSYIVFDDDRVVRIYSEFEQISQQVASLKEERIWTFEGKKTIYKPGFDHEKQEVTIPECYVKFNKTSLGEAEYLLQKPDTIGMLNMEYLRTCYGPNWGLEDLYWSLVDTDTGIVRLCDGTGELLNLWVLCDVSMYLDRFIVPEGEHEDEDITFTLFVRYSKSLPSNVSN